MQQSASLGARLRYRFDNALAKGPIVVIAYMGVLVLALIIVAGLIATIFGLTFGDGDENAFEAMYQSLLRMLDPGTFSGDASWGLRALTLIVTLIGVIIGGSLIGLIANGVDQRVEALNRGRGAVIESGHTLILGWSPQVPQIISELVIANESEKDAAVVVLAREEKSVMEETIAEILEDTKTTRVVCRNGDPSLPADLERACVSAARSIVAVRDEDGDAAVVKALLAIRSMDPSFQQCHVVAEIAADDNARTIRAVTDGRVLTVSSDRIVAEVTAQACLQSGLAAVFADLLDFDGDEIYFTEERQLVGKTYAEAQLGFDASSVIGLAGSDGVHLNPPPDRQLAAGDRLVLVASDDSAVAYTGVRSVTVPAAPTVEDSRIKPMRALVIGWSSFGALVMEQLDEFLVPGTTITVLIDRDLADPAEVQSVSIKNGTIKVATGGGGPEDIFALADAERPDQVIVLGYRDALSPADADARTLLSLLALRMVWPKQDPDHVRIVAELVDQRNLQIATPVGIDDLIVSDALASLMMAQLSEHAELLAVFEDLFDPDGSVIGLLPAETLLPPGTVEYATVVAAASARRASAFGIRKSATGEVTMNPAKSARVTLEPGDQVIVIEHRTHAPPPPAPAPAKRARSTSKTTRKG